MQMLFAFSYFVLYHILMRGQFVNEIPESNLIDFAFWNPTKDPSDYGLPLIFDLVFALWQ